LFHTTKDKPSMTVRQRHRFSNRNIEQPSRLGRECIGVSGALRERADAT